VRLAATVGGDSSVTHAGLILIAIAVLLGGLALRGYLREGRLSAQHRAWITIAAIFTGVAIVVAMLP
jgi:hypothetical protein